MISTSLLSPCSTSSRADVSSLILHSAPSATSASSVFDSSYLHLDPSPRKFLCCLFSYFLQKYSLLPGLCLFTVPCCTAVSFCKESLTFSTAPPSSHSCTASCHASCRSTSSFMAFTSSAVPRSDTFSLFNTSFTSSTASRSLSSYCLSLCYHYISTIPAAPRGNAISVTNRSVTSSTAPHSLHSYAAFSHASCRSMSFSLWPFLSL